VTPPPPKYQVVADTLRAEIRSGTIEPGQALPSTAELCSRFDVGAGAVREAVLILTHEGLVDTVPGVGRYARKSPAPDQG